MAFNLTLDDFNQLARTALKSADIDFGKTRVADRLRTVFQDRALADSNGQDSLELRKNLANVINELYSTGRGGEVVIPEAVARALNVSKLASGFKLNADGALVATNHPLTDRRLVCIMTAIKLDTDRYKTTFLNLDRRVSEMSDRENGSAFFRQFFLSAKPVFEALLATVRSAGDGAVKPAVLRAYLPSLRGKVVAIKDQFAATKDLVSDSERRELIELVNAAVDLVGDFGADVAKIEVPAAVEIPQFTAPLEIKDVEALVEAGPKSQKPEELVNERKSTLMLDLNKKLGSVLDGENIDIHELVRFSEKEIETFGKLDGDVQTVIDDKVKAIVDGVMAVADSELEPADRTKFLKQAISSDGQIDTFALKDAVNACRTKKYALIAQDCKQAFERNVAEKILSNVLGKESCATGLENLTKDFPSMKSFSRRVKLNHAGGSLPCFDLRRQETLISMLSGKLEEFKQAFDQADISKDLPAFERALDEVVEQTAEKIADRLVSVLEANVFEDDRTILALQVLDPSKADGFDKALGEAKRLYADNVLARVIQAQLPGKVAASKLSPLAKDVDGSGEKTRMEAMHSRFGFGEGETGKVEAKASGKAGKISGVVFSNRVKEAGEKSSKDDFSLGLNRDRGDQGAKMQSAVRGFFADLFTPAAKTPEGLKALMLRDASVLQTMLLDPALVESVAVPGDANNADAVRALVTKFLSAISDNVNNGQLTPADFKEALAAELDGEALRQFAGGLGDAGGKVLSAMQSKLTAELTDVLRKLSASGAGLQLEDKTLAELGASGLGSMDEGYGKFLANVLDNYFTSPLLAEDHDRMLESFFRNGKAGGTIGDALGALIKGAGPIFQKVLQSVPVDGLPDEVVKALFDVKSGLAPIADSEIETRLNDAIRDHNKSGEKPFVVGVEVVKSLGAASVGQALLCRFHQDNEYVSEKVVKLRRTGIGEIAERERVFFDQMAKDVNESMAKTFGSRIDGIMEELDFRNESAWIEKGQCYGKPDNYGDAAHFKFGSKMSVDSMRESKLMRSGADILVLDYVPGKPLDRNLRETRDRLDAITSKIARRTKNDKGEEVVSYRVNSSYDAVKTRGDLIGLYEGMKKQCKLIEELVRRFGSELFYRQYSEGTGGGFMHGDLHGGNMLISNGLLSVIDFGNSHQFTKEQRTQLIRFVAACGFSNAGSALDAVASLLGKKVGNLPDHKRLVADIGIILSKGDANDIASRGMAVVQYLQRSGVQVPGPIINFTETVMRLDAVHRETVALMDDIASVIDELGVDPGVGSRFDVYAGHPESVFKKYGENMANREGFVVAREEVENLHTRLSDYQRGGASAPLTRKEYDDIVQPLIGFLRDSTYTDNFVNPVGSVTIGRTVRAIARQLKDLGDRLYLPGPERDAGLPDGGKVPDLIRRLSECLSLAYCGMLERHQEVLNWAPGRASTINECMSVGLSQNGTKKLLSIVGALDGLDILKKGGKIVDEANLTLGRREMAGCAQMSYQHRVGMIDTRVRRIVDRVIDDHFIWSAKEKPQKFLASGWAKNPDRLKALSSLVTLNLKKLRKGLDAAGIASSETLENYAMIAFCMKHGVVDAIQEMKREDAVRMIDGLPSEEAKKLFRFLRTDESVVNAFRVGKCFFAATKKEVEPKTLETLLRFAQSSFPPLMQGGVMNWNDKIAVAALVKDLKNRYVLLNNKLDESFDKDERQVIVRYAMMRTLVDEGVLDALKKLDKKVLSTMFVEKAGGSKALSAMMQDLISFMSN